MKKKLNAYLLLGILAFSSTAAFGETTPQPKWKLETIQLELATATVETILQRAQLRMDATQKGAIIRKHSLPIKLEQLKK